MAQKPENRKPTTPQPDRVERSILRLAFDKDNSFQTDLRRRVDEYFQQGRRSDEIRKLENVLEVGLHSCLFHDLRMCSWSLWPRTCGKAWSWSFYSGCPPSESGSTLPMMEVINHIRIPLGSTRLRQGRWIWLEAVRTYGFGSTP